MVTVTNGHVMYIGDSEQLTIDCILLMKSFNDLKTKDRENYNDITENVCYLIKEDDTAREAVSSFIQNLSDIL